MNVHLTAADLAVVLGPVTGLLGLWLRLRWRSRQERARRKTLVALAQTLPHGCELEEHTADGTRLRITVGALPSGRGGVDVPARLVASAATTTAQRRGQR